MKENAKYRIYNRLNAFANVIMIAVGGSVGLLIGSSVLKYMEYRDNPVKYEIQSAPWYTKYPYRRSFDSCAVGSFHSGEVSLRCTV